MIQVLRAYFVFVPAAQRKFALVILFSVTGALSQAASVGLLLPALEVAQDPDRELGTGLIWRVLDSVYGGLGIPVGLLSLLLGVLVLVVVAQSLVYAQKHISIAIGEDFAAALRRRAFSTFMDTGMSFHNTVRSGTLTNTLSNDLNRTSSLLNAFMEFSSRSIMLVLWVAVLFTVSWASSLTALGIVAFSALLLQHHMRLSKIIGVQYTRAHEEFVGHAVERIDATRLVKVSNAEERETEQIGQLAKEVATATKRQQRRGAQIRLILEPSMAAAGIVATYIGLTFFSMSLAELAVFLYVLVRMVPEVQALNHARFNIVGSLVNFRNHIRWIGEAEAQTTILSGTRPFDGLEHSIVLEGVSFSYNGSAPVLQDIDLTIESNRFTAIVGPSGVGKSTLLDLIIRLVDPTRGRILIDGIDAREYDVGILHQKIGLVTQDVLLLNDTVLENIRYARPEASEEEVIEAAVRANAHSFIETLPQGYHTMLGSRGMTISGGERQRIALARTLLARPSVLLLDEVTSNLDADSERLIQESVFQAARDHTIVAVTHRLSTIQRADKVVVLDQGRISEEGPPEVLASRNGLFQRHMKYQMGLHDRT